MGAGSCPGVCPIDRSCRCLVNEQFLWNPDRCGTLSALPYQISLDPPIKQGQTRYHFLILLFSKDEDISLTLNMNE